MAINYLCKTCKNSFSLKHKKCPKCGEPVPRQNKLFYVRVMVNRQRVNKVVPGSLELAKSVEAKIKSELIENSYYDRRKHIPTLDEVWAKYLEWAKENKKTWRDDYYRYNYLLKEHFGNKALDQITPLEIERFKLSMKKINNGHGKPYTEATQLQYLALLRHLFNVAIRWGLYDGDNPVSKVKLPRPNNEVIEYLEPHQLKALWQVCENYYDRQAGNLVLFALVTGLRRGELFKLKWDDVDLNNGWLHLHDPKGKRDQILPLNKTASEILRNHPRVEGSPYVFPGKNGKMRTDFKTAWKTIKTMAKLPQRFRFHGLRHVYASLLASSGQVNPYTLQKLLTHKDFKTTQRYSHLLEKSFKESAEVIDSIIDRVKGDNVISVNFVARKV
ncbi:MAG: Tyrosine recombinase XerC [Candidatus Methanoperedenaceae archaeon GB50]|nr:MAG: Tyrosine recombinase XerC [Candidatus Methanoperedenaceae archaeon GB50]